MLLVVDQSCVSGNQEIVQGNFSGLICAAKSNK